MFWLSGDEYFGCFAVDDADVDSFVEMAGGDLIAMEVIPFHIIGGGVDAGVLHFGGKILEFAPSIGMAVGRYPGSVDVEGDVFDAVGERVFIGYGRGGSL